MNLLSEKEVAALLKCSVSALQKNRLKGNGLPYYKMGRSVRYSEESVLEYLKKHEYTSTSQYKGRAVAK